MNLAKFPRRRYTAYETPIEFLPNFTKALGGPNIYIKRDDLLEGAGGGNKTRKLEFLMADALAQAVQDAEVPGLAIGVDKAEGEKCERCWIYNTELGTDPEHPTLCPRCAAALKELA